MTIGRFPVHFALSQGRHKVNQTRRGSRDEQYPLTCFLYIHQNPLKAKLSSSLFGWPYSSYRDYTGERSGNLCSLQLGRRSLNLPEHGKEFEKFSIRSLNEDVVQEIF